MSRILPVKEQVLLAYYVQYYKENKPEAMFELHEQLKEEMEPGTYEIAMNELFDRGLINGLEKIRRYMETDGHTIKPMITNEGVLYINNVLNIQPYSMNKLADVRNSLATSAIGLSVPALAAYVEEAANA